MEQTDVEHLSLLTKRYDLFALALSIKVQQPVSWCHSICARARTYASTLARMHARSHVTVTRLVWIAEAAAAAGPESGERKGRSATFACFRDTDG